MAAKENTKAATNPADLSEWGEEVLAESKIVIEEKGDGFIARYMGMDLAGPKMWQGHFTFVRDLEGVKIADTAFMNLTRDLQQKLERVPVKNLVRVEWIDELDTGHESGTPMRIFRVNHKP